MKVTVGTLLFSIAEVELFTLIANEIGDKEITRKEFRELAEKFGTTKDIEGLRFPTEQHPYWIDHPTFYTHMNRKHLFLKTREEHFEMEVNDYWWRKNNKKKINAKKYFYTLNPDFNPDLLLERFKTILDNKDYAM